MSLTTKAATEGLYRLAARTPFNIAPERGAELAKEIFGSGKWEIRPSDQPATFAALPPEKVIYPSYPGLASLWCLAYAAFHLMDLACRQQRAPKAPGQTEIDIGTEFAA